MTNKELYDQAVANGFEFTYFHGEDECPEEFEDSKKEIFWRMEAGSEIIGARQNVVNLIKCSYYEDLAHDETADDGDKRVPDFITKNTTASEAAKITAYECYANFRYSSNGSGTLNKDDKDRMNIKYNDDRGFSDYFDVLP